MNILNTVSVEVNILVIVVSLVRTLVMLDLVVSDWFVVMFVVMSNEGLEMDIVVILIVGGIAVAVVGTGVEVVVINVFMIILGRVPVLGMVDGLVVVNKFMMNSLVMHGFVMIIIMVGPFVMNGLVLNDVVLRGNVSIMEGIEVHLGVSIERLVMVADLEVLLGNVCNLVVDYLVVGMNRLVMDWLVVLVLHHWVVVVIIVVDWLVVDRLMVNDGVNIAVDNFVVVLVLIMMNHGVSIVMNEGVVVNNGVLIVMNKNVVVDSWVLVVMDKAIVVNKRIVVDGRQVLNNWCAVNDGLVVNWQVVGLVAVIFVMNRLAVRVKLLVVDDWVLIAMDNFVVVLVLIMMNHGVSIVMNEGVVVNNGVLIVMNKNVVVDSWVLVVMDKAIVMNKSVVVLDWQVLDDGLMVNDGLMVDHRFVVDGQAVCIVVVIIVVRVDWLVMCLSIVTVVIPVVLASVVVSGGNSDDGSKCESSHLFEKKFVKLIIINHKLKYLPFL